MAITCICIATGRLERLRESIASFMSQNYAGEKQLIVFNVCHRQQLHGELPDVVFANAKQQMMPMRAKNLSVENAKHDIIVMWSEYDYYLPNHLQRIEDNMANRDWIWFDHEFVSESRRHLKEINGSESVFAFRRSAWKSAGGFTSGINGADDRNFVSRITARTNGARIPTPPSEITFIRIGNEMQRKSWTPSVKSGSIKVEPSTTRDYVVQVREHISGKTERGMCVVELGRYGDIVNLLPCLKIINDRYGKPNLCVSKHFSDLLDGVTYVKPYVVGLKNEELGAAIALAKEEFDIVVNAGVWGRGYQQKKTTESYNKESWKNVGMLHLFDDKKLKPEFDNRSSDREAELVNRVLGKNIDDRPVILVNVSAAISSPCKECATFLDAIRERWEPDCRVIDISNVRAERIYDMLGLFEVSNCLVCLDSAYVHLAQATEIPIIAIVNHKPWGGTIVRRNLVAQTDYEKLDVSVINKGIMKCVNDKLCREAGRKDA